MKRYQYTRAGPYVIQSLGPQKSPRADMDIRKPKQLASSPATVFMNQKNSWKQLKLLLAVNFPTPGSGLVVVLTFDDDHIPKSRGKTLDRLEYFRTKLREDRRRAGLPDPRIFWAPEVLTSRTGRWHVHMAIDSTGHDLPMIRQRWIYGTQIDGEPLRVDTEKNHETLAKYMSKELREAQEYVSKPGLHGWSHTRNIWKPEITVEIVPDDYELRAPPGFAVLNEHRQPTEFGNYHFQECVWRWPPGDGGADFY